MSQAGGIATLALIGTIIVTVSFLPAFVAWYRRAASRWGILIGLLVMNFFVGPTLFFSVGTLGAAACLLIWFGFLIWSITGAPARPAGPASA